MFGVLCSAATCVYVRVRGALRLELVHPMSGPHDNDRCSSCGHTDGHGHDCKLPPTPIQSFRFEISGLKARVAELEAGIDKMLGAPQCWHLPTWARAILVGLARAQPDTVKEAIATMPVEMPGGSSQPRRITRCVRCGRTGPPATEDYQPSALCPLCAAGFTNEAPPPPRDARPMVPDHGCRSGDMGREWDRQTAKAKAWDLENAVWIAWRNAGGELQRATQRTNEPLPDVWDEAIQRLPVPPLMAVNAVANAFRGSTAYLHHPDGRFVVVSKGERSCPTIEGLPKPSGTDCPGCGVESAQCLLGECANECCWCQRDLRQPTNEASTATVGWRVGRKAGRTLYRNEILVGIVDTPGVADELVAAANKQLFGELPEQVINIDAVGQAIYSVGNPIRAWSSDAPWDSDSDVTLCEWEREEYREMARAAVGVMP